MAQTRNSSVTPSYHVQSTAAELRGGFPYFAHHDSVSALWSEKWRSLAGAGIYPFTDGKVEDFDPIFAELIRVSDDDPTILYRPDEYAEPFFPIAERLVAQAGQATARAHAAEARDFFLRAAAVYRMARFPINRSERTQEAWVQGKVAYEQAGALLDPPSNAVAIPFTHADVSAGDLDVDVAAYLRLPNGPKPAEGWPVLLFICGLDAYRTDHTPRTQQHVNRGFATLSFEIPGTGDCPAAPGDPKSPDRLMSSVLDWVVANAEEYEFDSSRILARGISTGGYYAFRVAHTHAGKLFAVVAQGGGSHHMFDAEWIQAQNQMEYPFALADALAYKFGYRDGNSTTAVAEYADEASKFSLMSGGLIGAPTCKLLAINGMEDSIFPIEDSFIIATAGDKRDLVARGDRRHMGNPGAEEILYQWIDNVVAGKP